ncbi:MAG TPA: fatty acid desaturase [Acidimicrobiales bacterium]
MHAETPTAPLTRAPAPTEPSSTQPSTALPATLREVRAAIPARCYERSRPRVVLALVQALVLYLAPLAGLVFTDAWWALLPLWVLAGLGVSGLFVLGHDASHGALVRSQRLNRLIARACMVPSAHVEAAWALGHNRIHHGYTTRQGFDFAWHPATTEDYERMPRVARIRHRLEWSWLGAGAYYARTIWWQKMIRFRAPDRRRRAIVRDKAHLGAVVVVLALASAALGWHLDGAFGALWLPIKLFVVPFLVFAQVIGWTIYVHHVAPEIRWWRAKDWTQVRAQLESTTVLRVPRVVNRLWFHNIFLHVAHHVDARIPFHRLPAAIRAIAHAHPSLVRIRRVRLGDYLRATRACKLYDFDAGRWLPYPRARRSSVA